MKLCSGLLMVFCRNLYENAKSVYLNPSLGKLGVTHDLGKPRSTFYLPLLNFVRYGSGVIRRNVYSSAVFAGVSCFALKFYP